MAKVRRRVTGRFPGPAPARLGLWCAFGWALAACTGANGPHGVEPTPSAPVAAAPAAAPGAESRVTLLPPGQDPVEVVVEVARSAEDRRRGLMDRRQLDADRGMLFLFERPEQLSFWMHNTYIPLDMIFIRADMTVLGVVENAEPLTDTSRSVPGLSQYVLEVNAGFSRRHGIHAGTTVRFEGVAPLGEGAP